MRLRYLSAFFIFGLLWPDIARAQLYTPSLKQLAILSQVVPAPSGYSTVQEDGSNLAHRKTINFVGASITCADDGGTRTTCTITSVTNPFSDATAIVMDNGDNTKLVRIEVSGVSAGNTRVWTAPDSNTFIPIIPQTVTITGPTASRSYAFPDSAATIAALNVAQSFTALQKFPGSGTNSLQIGSSASTFNSSVLIGEAASLGGDSQTVIGYQADCNSASTAGCVAIGRQASSRSLEGISIGFNAFTSSGHSQSIALGGGANTTAAFQMVVGAFNGREVTHYYWGGGVTSTTSIPDIDFNATGGSGTDKAGGNYLFRGGRGTGTGRGGDLIFQTSPSLTTGTTAQTPETRARVVAKQFPLTDATAATFAVVTLGNDTRAGGTIAYCVEAEDASHEQIECGEVDYGGVDNTAGAGGEVCPAPTKQGTPLNVPTSGTLAVTFTGTTGTDLCNLRVAADSSLTPTTLFIRWSIVHSNGRTVTPQ